MSYVAEFTIPPKAFPFGETLLAMPDIEIEVDQIIPVGESAFPFFWVRGCEPEEFMAAAEQESAVRETRKLESVEHTALYRAEWIPDASVIQGLTSLDVTVVTGVGTADNWRFEVRMEDRGEFQSFRDIFEARGTQFDLLRIYNLEDTLAEDENGITEDQREALLTAYEDGYFDLPRETTLDEIGTQFDISSRAVSERLRRGTRNLIQSELMQGINGE